MFYALGKDHRHARALCDARWESNACQTRIVVAEVKGPARCRESRGVDGCDLTNDANWRKETRRQDTRKVSALWGDQGHDLDSMHLYYTIHMRIHNEERMGVKRLLDKFPVKYLHCGMIRIKVQ